MASNLILILLTGILVGAVSGYLGSFMVLKRMSLVGDALSHVALPGMALALVWGINPMLGAVVALFVAIIGIWWVSEKSNIYPEAVVGVFFTASLAIGILITPEPELLEALFGNLEKIGLIDGAITAVCALVVFVVTRSIAQKLILGVVSEDLARTTGIKISKINLIYLLMVGLVVALGIKFVGTLLMGALVIIPAVAAKNIAKSTRTFQLLSAFFGVASVVLGIIIGQIFMISSGPAIVLVSVVFFVLSAAIA